MGIKRIHINQHRIRSNAKVTQGERLPVVTCKTSKANHYGFEVEVLGPSKVIYSPDKPMSCGARVWITCTCPVLIDGKKVE